MDALSPMKKNSQDLVEDLLSGQSGLTESLTPEELTKFIEDNYEVNEDELRVVLRSNRAKIEEAVGVSITDEQLAQLAGGKSENRKSGIAVTLLFIK